MKETFNRKSEIYILKAFSLITQDKKVLAINWRNFTEIFVVLLILELNLGNLSFYSRNSYTTHCPYTNPDRDFSIFNSFSMINPPSK